MTESTKSRILIPARRSLEEELRGAFRTPGVIKRSLHPLSSGVTEGFYLDFDLLVQDPVQCQKIVSLIAEKVSTLAERVDIDFLAFLEKPDNTTGAITIAGALSIETGIPHLVIRLKKDIWFDRIKLPQKAGDDALADRKVVVITDHITRGNELLAAATNVSKKGAAVTAVLAYTLNREEFQWEEFKKAGIEVACVWSTEDALAAVPSS